MKAVYHGGMCCGVKTIYSLSSGPDYMFGAREKCSDKIGLTNRLVFNETVPKEKAKVRLHRIVTALEKPMYGKNMQGLIEVVLCDRRGDGQGQVGNWRATLESYGFKEVISSMNSNSSNRVYVFYRISGEAPPLPEIDYKEGVEEE